MAESLADAKMRFFKTNTAGAPANQSMQDYEHRYYKQNISGRITGDYQDDKYQYYKEACTVQSLSTTGTINDLIIRLLRKLLNRTDGSLQDLEYAYFTTH